MFKGFTIGDHVAHRFNGGTGTIVRVIRRGVFAVKWDFNIFEGQVERGYLRHA